MNDTTNAPDLSELTQDGDTLELGNGRTLRLKIEPDDIDLFREFDSYGKIAPVRDARNVYGYRERPDGFDGNAEKLSYGGGDSVWWQPSPDGPKRGTPEFDKERSLVLHLLEYGPCVVLLEVLQGKDAYGHDIVIDVDSLGGIDSLEDGYLATVVSDLWAELEGRLKGI